MAKIGRVTARGIIYKDGTLFAVRQKDYDTGEWKDFWCLPGGRLEDTESITDCAVRELQEELGVKPELGNLLYVQQYGDDGEQHIEFFFHVINVGDFEAVELETTSHGVREIAEFGFIDPANVKFLPEFLQTADIQRDIDAGTTQFFSYL